MLNIKYNHSLERKYSYKIVFCILSIFVLTSFYSEISMANTLPKLDVNLPSESVGVPKLAFEKDSYDFGDIKPNSTNKAVFNLTNTGDGLLIIKEVKKCCGAVISLDKEELEPGESGVLTAEYRAGMGTGILKKTIRIITNEPNSTETKLTITGQMIQTLKWEPGSFEISPFSGNIECPEIKINSLNNTKFSIKKIRVSSNCISTNYDPNYSTTEIVLKPVATEKIKELDSGQGIISIELSHPDYKTINLYFNILQSLQATPQEILIFNAEENGPIDKTIEIRDNQNQNDTNISKQIESIILESGAKVEIVKSSMVEKNCRLDLKITPFTKENSESALKDQLVIKMKDGRELNVPIRIFFTTSNL